MLLPESVKTIASCAFYECASLERIVIPASVTEMAADLFWRCDNLAAIEVSPDNEVSCSVDGVVFTKDKKGMWIYPNGKSWVYEVPEGTQTLNQAFYGCYGLESVTVPASVRVLSDHAFDQCIGLQSVHLPETLTEIGEQAFWECSSLTEIRLPESLKRIGSSAFFACSRRKKIVLPAAVTEMESDVFPCCISLTGFEVPSANTAFASVDGVLYTRDQKTLLYYPNAKGISYEVLPGTVEIRGAFAGCIDLQQVKLPEGLLKIDYMSFDGCSSLRVISLPESLLEIGNHAFHGCESLKAIAIPKNVDIIFEYTFANCDSLESVTFYNDSVTIEEAAFDAEDPEKVKNLVIYGNPNSSAQRYAREHGLAFKEIPAPDTPAKVPEVGDVFQAPDGNFYQETKKSKEAAFFKVSIDTNMLLVPAAVVYGGKTYQVTSIVRDAVYKELLKSSGMPSGGKIKKN